MIPIALITGFLGAGKTTYLQRIVQANRDRRLLYLVNDFASVDIDAQLIAAAGEDVVSIAGGSIFCRCLITEFIGQMKAILDRHDDAPIEGVVIEASGMADPGSIGRMLSESRLDSHFRLSTVVSVIDPCSLHKLLNTLPNIKSQIRAADWVIINKVDACGPQVLRQAEDAVIEINPRARLLRASYCEVDLDLFAGEATQTLTDDYTACRDESYKTLQLQWQEPVDLDWLEGELRANETALFRAKGFVPTEQGMFFVDYSDSGWRFIYADDQNAKPQLVLIARQAQGEALFEKFQAQPGVHVY